MKQQNILSKSQNPVAVLGLALVTALAICPATQGQEVKTNYLPNTEFSKFRTYNWVTIGVLPHPDQILDAEIKQSIDSQLVAKGFMKVDSDKPDLLLDYQVLINQEKQWNATGMRDILGLGMSTPTATATSSTINMGTLVVNIYDSAAKQLVWTGFATKEINLSKNQEKTGKTLTKRLRSC